MGLFNNYMKPGKGVSKDEPEKKGFFLYWDIVFHKFSKIMGANCILGLTSILWFFVLMFIIIQFIAPTLPEAISGILVNSGAENANDAAQTLTFSIYVMLINLIFVFWGSGPVSASYAYISKCFTNHQHAWIMSDGWEKFKENFKQAIVVVIIDAVMLVVGAIAIRFYSIKFHEGSMIFGIPCYLLIVATIVYSWMHFYLYQIMVTFKCTLKQMYKNALIFALGKLPMNILLTIIAGGITILPYVLIGNPFVSMILSILIGLFLSRFAIEFYTARQMGNIITNITEKEDKKDEDEESVFDDDIDKKLKRIRERSEANK